MVDFGSQISATPKFEAPFLSPSILHHSCAALEAPCPVQPNRSRSIKSTSDLGQLYIYVKLFYVPQEKHFLLSICRCLAFTWTNGSWTRSWGACAFCSTASSCVSPSWQNLMSSLLWICLCAEITDHVDGLLRGNFLLLYLCNMKHGWHLQAVWVPHEGREVHLLTLHWVLFLFGLSSF